MTDTFNIYCDESCHLENDGQPYMVLGALWCPLEKREEISNQINEIKRNHNMDSKFEIKWTKVSQAKIDFYLDIVNYFFDNDDLHFRALIADKTNLNHEQYSQDHDDWYYKMYFDMLKVIFNPKANYRIYLDIKDSWGGRKVNKLHDVLCNNIYDFSRSIIERVQLVHSKEIVQIQISDLLIGAISYVNRELQTSAGKCQLFERLQERSGYSLKATTLLREEKFNLFFWHGTD